MLHGYCSGLHWRCGFSFSVRVFRSRGALFFSPVSKKSGSWEHLSLAFFFFGPHCMVCGILVPQLWIEPTPPALEVLCPEHWTTREVNPSLAVLSVWPSLHTLTLLSDFVCSRCQSPPKKPGLVPRPLACLPSLFLPFILGTGPGRKV